ncbi:MAG: hypothetical protein OXG58_01570 [Gemmatimonadetes bacterium]|nr:hypothetical protein [Gemmatimonadota bacterium]MCY3943435.1 hypothetical protein [Gemmatimonadota bacterium]
MLRRRRLVSNRSALLLCLAAGCAPILGGSVSAQSANAQQVEGEVAGKGANPLLRVADATLAGGIAVGLPIAVVFGLDGGVAGVAGLQIAPLVAHLYAGDVRRGLKPLALTAGGFGLMELGLHLSCRGELKRSGPRTPVACIQSLGPVGVLGVSAFYGGWGWSMVSAMLTAWRRPAWSGGVERPPFVDASLDLGVTPQGQLAMGVALHL